MNSEDPRRRIVFVGYLIIVVFAVFLFRLWQLQVLGGKRYLLLSESNKIKVLKLAAPRGIIYDRNGTALVKNTPYYSASLIPGAVRDVDTRALSELLSMDEGDIVESEGLIAPVIYSGRWAEFKVQAANSLGWYTSIEVIGNIHENADLLEDV